MLTSAIELVHGDPDLNYQVFEEVGNGNVVAEWQNWGKKLRLPLYIKAGDGSLLPYSQQVSGVALGQPGGAPQAGARCRAPPALPQPPPAGRNLRPARLQPFAASPVTYSAGQVVCTTYRPGKPR